jgi:predicted permease
MTMKRIRRVILKFRGLFTNSKTEAELAREIAAHLQLLEDEFRAQGMTAEQARLAARRKYGGVEQAKQMHRDERSFPGLAQTLKDIRYTTRQLRKSPGFTTTAILMLAFGIGATTAIFSIIEGVLLRPLPFPDPGRLVILGDDLVGSNCAYCAHPLVTAPDIRNYMRDMQSFTHLGGYAYTRLELTGEGDPAYILATRMSAEAFPALSVTPLLGRWFTRQEDDQHQMVTVLSYGMWRTRFAGDQRIIDKRILLDRKPYVVIGVMPRDFEFPLMRGHVYQSELWVPLSLEPEEFTAGNAASWHMRMVGRLKSSITAEQAQGEAQRVAEETMRNYPGFMRSLRIRSIVQPLEEDTVSEVRPMLRTLFLAVAVVLLIACANLAGLLLVRSIRRRRELALRLALGARAATLLRQAMVESLLLSTAGGLVGLTLAAGALRVGVSLLPETLPRLNEIRLNWPVVCFALVLAVLTGLVCGLAPALVAIQTSVNDALKQGGRTGSAGHARLRSALVITEIAVALVLLTTSGLFLRSYDKMRQVDLGFHPDHVLSANYALPPKQYATQAAVDGFCNSLLRALRQLPGVEAAGISSFIPGYGDDGGIALTIDGYVPQKGGGLNMATDWLLQGDPLQALGIRLLRGRMLTDADKADSQLVVLVNRKLAQHYWPGQDPIGKRLRRGMTETSTPWLTVVGEVDDVKVGTPDSRTAEQIYQPVSQVVASEGVFAGAGELSAYAGVILLRTATDPEQMENALRAAVHDIDPQLPLTHIRTMEQTLSEGTAPRRFNTVLISSFASVAVLLAVLGIYGVIAFSAALREQEMALRMALGCQRSGVLQLVLISGAKLAAAGSLLGLVGAIAVSGLLRSFLFAVSPFDPLVLTLSVAAMLLLAVAASTLPASRASKVDPGMALRGD